MENCTINVTEQLGIYYLEINNNAIYSRTEISETHAKILLYELGIELTEY